MSNNKNVIFSQKESNQFVEQSRYNKHNFNLDWKFIKEDVTDASELDFDDSSWTIISTPHTYNDTDTFDNFMEGGHNGERNMFTGKTWYRKHFKLESQYQNKKIFIEFEGIRQAAEIYLNGHRLDGKSENGFIPFGYDLTPYVNFGDENNVLAIMVDNTFPYYADGTDDILSWHDSHWHPTHGGIYRNVYLHIKNKLHITLPLYSYLKTQGMYVYATDIKEKSANIYVEAEVMNDHDITKEVNFIAEIINHHGELIQTLKISRKLEAGDQFIFQVSGQMENPHRWSPKYPYIYTVRSKLEVEGEVVDTTDTPLGIRTFGFTNDQGFFINGQSVKLTGWGQRPTNEWAGLGTAYPNWMHEYIFEQMKEAGGNMIRWGHSAGAPVHVELADKYGLITIQPGVDGEGSTVGGVYSEVAYNIRSDAYRDMLIYYRNNPSILIWEGGNQSVPDTEAERLKNLTETWDPYGRRVYAHRRSNLVMAKYIDVSIGTEGSWELKSKGKPVVEGEYNREEAARRVWDRHTPGYENYQTSESSDYNLTSEEFAKNQAKHFAKISHLAHCGGANWIYSDSTSHGRVHSEVARVSGQVDGVMLPKEAYFATKAIYREDPQVHIIGHWNYPKGTVKDIYVMSNTTQVELFINDISQGFGEVSDTYLFTFKNIKWESGTIKAVAYDENKKVVSENTKKTVGKPVAVKLTSITGPEGLKADGADIVLIDVEVVDELGNRVPTYEGQINFSMEGPSIWRGGYNSGKEYSTNNTFLDIEAGINRVAVRSTLTPGLITVTSVIEGLKTDSITIKALPVPLEVGLSTELPILSKYELGEEPPLGNGPVEKLHGREIELPTSELITDFSYSGIIEPSGIKTSAGIGDLIYNDEEYEFQFLPEFLIGSDYIQVANQETTYKALDLIHFSVSEHAKIYIAHDDRLMRPGWLIENFIETGKKLIVGDAMHSLYNKIVEAETTLTLGGNQDESNITNSNMYVVFVHSK